MAYNPTLGRWMQLDPIGYVDGMGLYERERSGPLDCVDPSGLFVPATVFGNLERRYPEFYAHLTNAGLTIFVYDAQLVKYDDGTTEKAGAVRGTTTPDGRTIYISGALDDENATAVLLHELRHSMTNLAKKPKEFGDEALCIEAEINALLKHAERI